MARGNLIQGQGSGKVGDIVLMVRNGQQVSRVYTESGARSGKEASEASRIQRVKFGSASNQWSLYRYVSTRMYRKGKSVKLSDYNYFVKRNQALLPYFSKSENLIGVQVLQPGVFSDGSLGNIELTYNMSSTYVEGAFSMSIHISGIYHSSSIAWSDKVSVLKERLQVVFPFARKVTYLLSSADEIVLSESGSTFVSQQVNHYPVILDLYDESTIGEDDMTISSFFSSRVGDTIAQVINAQNDKSFLTGNRSIAFSANSQELFNTINKVSCLIFATDDVASDCYTTILPSDAVPPTHGVYADWSAYRTNRALRIAADSYGYQTGVMRDEIASLGNDISVQVQAYAARLANFDEGASKAFLKSVGDVSKVQAKAVVKSAEEK